MTQAGVLPDRRDTFRILDHPIAPIGEHGVSGDDHSNERRGVQTAFNGRATLSSEAVVVWGWSFVDFRNGEWTGPLSLNTPCAQTRLFAEGRFGTTLRAKQSVRCGSCEFGRQGNRQSANAGWRGCERRDHVAATDGRVSRNEGQRFSRAGRIHGCRWRRKGFYSCKLKRVASLPMRRRWTFSDSCTFEVQLQQLGKPPGCWCQE